MHKEGVYKVEHGKRRREYTKSIKRVRRECARSRGMKCGRSKECAWRAEATKGMDKVSRE